MTDGQEYIYALGHPHGFAKIGRSENPRERCADLQTGSPYELWLIVQVPVPDSRQIETQLHERLADKRRRGEWFELDYDDYDDLFDMVKMAASNHEFESVEALREWQARQRRAML